MGRGQPDFKMRCAGGTDRSHCHERDLANSSRVVLHRFEQEVTRGGGCGARHYPRTDPVVIMVVADGERCLLGRSARRVTGLYSALAGFVDQGESIEEAVRREVREEAGIRVGAVRYHSSQPWPFPSSLMIGCHGQALSRDITIDPEEMTAVEWFHRDDVRNAMAGDHPDLNLPGPIAIAHHLIRAWLDGTSGL